MAKAATSGGRKSSASKSTTRKSKSTTTKASASPEELLKLYEDMLSIRRFEEKAGQLYGMGLIGGFCHLYIGQEAVVVGMQAVAKPVDSLVTSYRDHGHMIACDMDMKGVMAELTGRRGGYSHGKGGSMHMFSSEKNFYGGHGIVAAQVPIGAGLAFKHQYTGDGGVNANYMGDGAVNQGQVYEAFNMAALWKLPVIFVIENNKYGMGTSVARASASTELFKRGEAYGIPGVAVNGMDVLEVKAAAEKAYEHCRSGKGPMVLEMKTYRYRGHSMSDPAKYRSKEEVDKMRKESDPIDMLKSKILEQGVADEAQLKEIDKKVKAAVSEAAEFAQQSPEPELSELYTDILIES